MSSAASGAKAASFPHNAIRSRSRLALLVADDGDGGQLVIDGGHQCLLEQGLKAIGIVDKAHNGVPVWQWRRLATQQGEPIVMSSFQGRSAFDRSPMSARGIDGLDAAARDNG
jgi:hypothetical protein